LFSDTKSYIIFLFDVWSMLILFLWLNFVLTLMAIVYSIILFYNMISYEIKFFNFFLIILNVENEDSSHHLLTYVASFQLEGLLLEVPIHLYGQSTIKASVTTVEMFYQMVRFQILL
jgi:hypothetical protein